MATTTFYRPLLGNRMMNYKTKALLNLQSLEFSPGQPRRNGAGRRMVESIKRIRAGLSIQVLREYDFRKKRYGSRCVVPLLNGICTGCQVTLSLQTKRISRYHIVECEHCGRLLYNPEKRHRLRIEVCAA